jgi:hypothetical protein
VFWPRMRQNEFEIDHRICRRAGELSGWDCCGKPRASAAGWSQSCAIMGLSVRGGGAALDGQRRDQYFMSKPATKPLRSTPTLEMPKNLNLVLKIIGAAVSRESRNRTHHHFPDLARRIGVPKGARKCPLEKWSRSRSLRRRSWTRWAPFPRALS